MFVFHSILNDKKTQSNHLFIGKNHQLGFMLVEMIFGVLIFVATLSIAYKYLGLIRSLVKKVGEYNQVIDEVSSALERGRSINRIMLYGKHIRIRRNYNPV